MNEKRFSVWVGGGEVNNFLLTKDDAIELAFEYLDDEYDDVQVIDTETNEAIPIE